MSSSSSSKIVLITSLLSIAALSMTSAQVTGLTGSIINGVISCPVTIVNNPTTVARATVNLVNAAGIIIAATTSNDLGAFTMLVSGAQDITNTSIATLKVILPEGTPCGVVNQVVQVPLFIVTTVTGSALASVLNLAAVLTSTLGPVLGILNLNGGILASVTGALGNVNFIAPGVLPF